MSVPHLLIVDGANLMNRAWYTLGGAPTLDALPDKVRTMLLGAVRRWEATHLLFALDSPDCFRKGAIPGYKESRSDRGAPSTSEMTEALRPHLQRWGLALREAPHMEADDVIASLVGAAAYAAARPCAVSILTRDTDLLQLVNDERHVRVLWPGGRGELETVMDEPAVADYLTGHKEIGAAFAPPLLLDFRVIAGGKDNLPRIEVRDGKPPYGFTTRRTAQLLSEGVTLDTLRSWSSLSRRECGWVDTCWEAASARYDALTLRSWVVPERSGGSSAVSTLRLAGA